MKIIKRLTFLMVLFVYHNLSAQTTFLPVDSKEIHLTDRLEIKYGKNTDLIFSTLKPYSRRSLVQQAEWIDSVNRLKSIGLTAVDEYNLHSLLMNNSEWVTGPKESFESKKPILNTFYTTKPNLLEVDVKDFFLAVNPVLSLQIGSESGNDQTLYFNSDGLPGYSEKPDLFVTRKLPDGTWSKPENLGYPINTIDDEGSLVVSADGKTAYYSSDRSDTKGGLDIYTFELRNDIRPLKTLWVNGKVYDKTTGIGLPSTVELTDINSQQIISLLQTDEDGNYLVTLPIGKEYAFNVQRKGYLFYSENYNLINHVDSVFTANIPLQPIKANATVILKNIFFDTKESKLKPSSIYATIHQIYFCYRRCYFFFR